MQALFAEQATGVDKLRHYKVGALFMDPGTGKTRTALELVRGLGPECDHVLWLAPYRLVWPKVAGSGIQDEVRKWGGTYRETMFCGIETLSSSDRTYLELMDLVESRKCAVVVDESLKIKNWGAKRTQRIIALGKLAQYRLLLNGTPLSRNLLDLWAQMEFLSPRILGMGIAEYKKTFCEFTVMTKHIGHRTIRREWINRYHNVEHLYRLIEHYVYEADLDLAIGSQYIDVAYRLGPDERAEYDRIKTTYLDDEKMEAKNNNIFLEMTMKMQHAYCCTAEKFAWMDRLLEQAPAQHVIIYCKFVASREACTKRYPKCTVLSIQSDALGLNLQDRNVTVFWDKTWDFATLDQAMHRTKRKGQQRDCIFYDLSGNVGLEDMITKNVAGKKDLLQYFKEKSVKDLMAEL